MPPDFQKAISMGAVRASPMTSCTCICIWERKVGSIRDAKANACKSASHACIPKAMATLLYPKLPLYRKPCTTKLASGLSYLTGTTGHIPGSASASWMRKCRCRGGSRTSGLALSVTILLAKSGQEDMGF